MHGYLTPEYIGAWAEMRESSDFPNINEYSDFDRVNRPLDPSQKPARSSWIGTDAEEVAPAKTLPVSPGLTGCSAGSRRNLQSRGTWHERRIS
jgi:hypothetical protein